MLLNKVNGVHWKHPEKIPCDDCGFVPAWYRDITRGEHNFYLCEKHAMLRKMQGHAVVASLWKT